MSSLTQHAGRRWRFAGAAVVVAAAAVVVPLKFARATGPACTPVNHAECLRFSYTGSNQTFTVPSGVTQIDAHGWVVLAIGFVVSFLVAYASVAWFMAWVRQRGFVPFAIYRIVFGAVVLIYALKLP